MTLDWQTVVVTIVALGAALVIVRRFVPARRRSGTRPGSAAAPIACDHCETGAKATRTATSGNGSTARTQTTPVVSVGDLRASSKARRRG
jgi:hypothetical protein